MTSPLMNNYLNFASGIAHQQYLPPKKVSLGLLTMVAPTGMWMEVCMGKWFQTGLLNGSKI